MTRAMFVVNREGVPPTMDPWTARAVPRCATAAARFMNETLFNIYVSILSCKKRRHVSELRGSRGLHHDRGR